MEFSSSGRPFRPVTVYASPKKRILVVDDDQCLTKLVVLFLARSDSYFVRVENDPAKAISAAMEFRPDLILMDISMPDLDGAELASRMKALPALRSVPIVFLTGSVTADEAAEHAGYVGGPKFLAKPFGSEDLLNCVVRQLA
jgi:CheY-like chemotaxis protein